ncbi:MAG TPA: hypothetical protein V6C81_11290 [Planktothrix sp.]|jgi:hypothetical protein
MSVTYVSRRKRVKEPVFHCDGPHHQSKPQQIEDAIIMDHGYGSPFDGDQHHFCSISCLKDWAQEQTDPHNPELSAAGSGVLFVPSAQV